jgi:hypothetical protein
LLYPALALEEAGATVREIEYPADLPAALGLDEGREFFAEVGPRVQAVIDEGWSAVTFVAKSRGTMVLGAIGHELVVPSSASVVWVTPMFSLDYVRDGAVALGWRSLIVSGASDDYYDAAATAEVVTALGARELVIEGADHVLEVAGDVRATLSGMARVVEAVASFSRDCR